MYPSGLLIKRFATVHSTASGDVWGATLSYTISSVIAACLAIMAIYWWYL